MTALPLVLGLPAIGGAIGLGVYLLADRKPRAAPRPRRRPGCYAAGCRPPGRRPTRPRCRRCCAGSARLAAKVTPADYAAAHPAPPRPGRQPAGPGRRSACSRSRASG